MNIFAILGITLFVISYVFITLEHKLGTHKSAIALATGAALWILVALSGIDHEVLKHSIEEAGAEIFAIVAFLLAAMAIIEILVHYRFFDLIRLKLLKLGLQDKGQFLMIAVITFFLSAVLDNLTTTIVMIQIARRFFAGKNLLVMVSSIVIMANAGGAWSPIGDVTTIMIWLAQKFSSVDIITQGFLPSFSLAIVSGALLLREIKKEKREAVQEEKITLSKSEKVVVSLSLVSFSFPIIMNAIGLQPYMGLLLGLGLVWLFIEFAKVRSKRSTHLDASIENLLQKTDIASLKFFIGILLSVSALNALGVLEKISVFILGEHQEFSRVIIGNVVLGLLSSIVDNVPLTALAIDIIKVSDPHLWVLLALTVGTGGSFLIIGSVAGVVAMGIIKELTFEKYMRIASIPALLGYITAVGVWLLQYQLIK